ncbi:unnamed protein product [Rotaria socialis]|uniref:Glycine amidinotransferase n=2 Tax=Rotaria socialis TaxID=392032 RepID=A0A821W6R8_9BILA|nr:unnamed protein product [Rotaria socialis]
MASSPLVNSWTEWGQLELVCVGSAYGMCYPDESPAYDPHALPDRIRRYLQTFVGSRPQSRIQQAEAELDYLADLLRAESVKVAHSLVDELDEDIEEVLSRRKTSLAESSPTTDGRLVQKGKIDVCRPISLSDEQPRFDHRLSTPNFTSNYQFGLACPRDVIITMGDTVPPKATCSPLRMFRDVDFWGKVSYEEFSDSVYANSGYKTNLNEAEIAFEAADMMRMGKDVFYKKSDTANNQGLLWLRRTFPNLRFHMAHFPTSSNCHLDVSLVPLRPPTPGSDGLVLVNQTFPPLANEMKLFTDNDWRPIWAPLPATSSVPPFALCSCQLSMNLLSLNDHCVVIEECELPLYRLLHDELGFDVITCPLRVLNEFGGGIHCGIHCFDQFFLIFLKINANAFLLYLVTWDIRRQDSCIDYFPNQDYKAECQLDLNNYFDKIPLVNDTTKKF